MKYCSRCLYPENHPLTISFDETGLCSGCRVHDEKFNGLDWKEREEKFKKLVGYYKERDGSCYDCIIPVVGNGDDFYVVDKIKNEYGLNPLLVTYNTHFNTKVGVRNLSRLITELDCDHLYYTVGPESVKKITKLSLERLGHVYWHVMAGQLTFPVQIGTKFNVPLIVWGVHSWSDQVGMFSHLDVVEMTRKVRREHSLKMFDAESLIGTDPTLSTKDLMAFTYPSDEQLEECRVRGIYVSNFFKWDSQDQTENMIKKYGFETSDQERTFNTYETIHCHVNAGIHDYIKFLKFGYGKATDHATRDIRLKRMTREQGIEHVCNYDHMKPSNFNDFLDWLGVSEEYFYECVDKYRDPSTWKKDKAGKWKLLDNVSNHKADEFVEMNRLEVSDPREYIKTDLLEAETKDFILTGRTYLDKWNYKAVEG